MEAGAACVRNMGGTTKPWGVGEIRGIEVGGIVRVPGGGIHLPILQA
jgi:hypothetical protein